MIVGITGSIASGKSTVARVFELLGYHVFYADNEAKKLYENPLVAQKLNQAIHHDFVDHSKPDFKKIADFVFSSADNGQKVTNILYPFLLQGFKEWTNTFADEHLLFMEAAMLFESGWNSLVDSVICVHCNEQTRFERIKHRNAGEANNFILRSKYQLSDDEKIKLSDYIINNDHNAIIPQIFAFLKRYDSGCYNSNDNNTTCCTSNNNIIG